VSFQPDTIIITSDEPYSAIWHTQLIYAAFLGKSCNVIYVNPPSKWNPFNLLRLSTAVIKPKGENFLVFSYRNVLPALSKKLLAINESLNTFLMARHLKKKNSRNVVVWHFDSYRGLFNSESFRKQFTVKHLYHVIDPYYNNPLNDQLAEVAELIVLTSPANNVYYKRHKHKLLNVPQSVDPELSGRQLMPEPTAFVPSSPFIVLLGTISDDLEFDWLLDLVADPAVYLLIIGSVKSLSRHAKDLEGVLKHKNVKNLGPLPPAKFYPILKRAKAGIVLYNRERREYHFSPLKAVNYLVAGIPVISNCNCEIPALLDQCIYEVSQYDSFRERVYKSLENDLPFDVEKAADYLDDISINKAVEKILEKL
jgi:hypothetical protein